MQPPTQAHDLLLDLRPHPETPASWLSRVRVQARRGTEGSLDLSYQLAGDLTHLKVPPKTTPERRDFLWQHTCFEAFLSPMGRGEYLEFNFAPSTQWAAYTFSDYRERSADPELTTPDIHCIWDTQGLELKVKVDLKPSGFSMGPLRLGLAAVLETQDGSLSYWALAHGPGKPDFHRSETFTARMD